MNIHAIQTKTTTKKSETTHLHKSHTLEENSTAFSSPQLSHMICIHEWS